MRRISPRSFRPFVLALLATSLAPTALRPDEAEIRGAGFDPPRIAALRARMQDFVERGEVAGIVVAVGRRGKPPLLEAAGWQDLEARVPMRSDSIFRIASMTKPITALAVMILADESKLAVDDPLEKHLREFQGQMLVRRRAEGELTLGKPPRPITLKDLLTHTSGMPGGPPPGLAELYRRRDHTLAEAVMAFSQRPLEFEPGSSSAADLARLYALLLDRGNAGERRVLSESALAAMTQIQTGEMRCGFTDGVGMGLGFQVVKEPSGVTASLSPGSYGHGGAFGTQGWIDPGRGVYFILLIQRAGLPNADASDLRRVLQEAAVGALE